VDYSILHRNGLAYVQKRSAEIKNDAFPDHLTDGQRLIVPSQEPYPIPGLSGLACPFGCYPRWKILGTPLGTCNV